MVLPDSLQRLRSLDRVSPQFYEQLGDLFRGDEYRNAVQSLQGEDLAWLVEYLDGVIVGIPDPASPQFHESLNELGKLCGAKEVLPKSCTLRVKRVKVHQNGDPRKVRETFHQAAVVWKHLVHPNIVPLLGVTVDPLQLVSDRISGGNLLGYITKYPDSDRLGLLSDIAEGLNYLHSCNVIHGGLKGPNVLVDSTGRGRITDFGLATVTQNLDLLRSSSAEHGHSARWTAPEILNGQGTYSKEADVFSFAMVAIEAFTGAVPFSDKPPHTIMSAIVGGERPPRPTHPTLTDGLWELTQQCWDQEAHLRPPVLRILCGFIPAWKRLVDLPLATNQRIPLVTAIFSDPNETEAVGCLRGADSQSFVDVVDETLDALEPWLRAECLGALRNICGRQALLPRSLQIPLCYNPTDVPLHCGEYADMWKGEHRGRHVVAKVLRVHSMTDFYKTTSRFCKEAMTWKTLHHPNVLPLLGVTTSNYQFATVWEWMESGNITEFVKSHGDANRFELLRDAALGLIYLHDQGLVHGNLKGANVLIDQSGHARLADFGLSAMSPEPAYPTTSNPLVNAGIIRWMSPELLDPDQFGFENSRPTAESDCYALGMVILEVFSGQIPFPHYNSLVVIRKVTTGERPARLRGVEGAWASDDLWEALELCWSPQPTSRPTIKAVLGCLKRASTVLQSPPPSTDGGVEAGTDDGSYSTVGRPLSGFQTPPSLRFLAGPSKMGIDASGISPTSSQVALSQLPEQLYLEESVETDNIAPYNRPGDRPPPPVSLSPARGPTREDMGRASTEPNDPPASPSHIHAGPGPVNVSSPSLTSPTAATLPGPGRGSGSGTSRLDTGVGTFLPRKVTIRSLDGREVDFGAWRKKDAPASPVVESNAPLTHQTHQKRISVVRMETVEAKEKRLAEENSVTNLEPVAPLVVSPNRWTRHRPTDEVQTVERKVKALLNKLAIKNFDSISDQIIQWANKSEAEKDGRTLAHVSRLVFEKATDEAPWSGMYAQLCRKMMEAISPNVVDDGIRHADSTFRKHLLNRCQEGLERGWAAKDAAAFVEASGKIELYSDEYYIVQKAKRQGLGLIQLIGELYKVQMLTERIMHECVKKFLGNVENPGEEEIESLCRLLATAGKLLDNPKARAHMDIYFTRMRDLWKSNNVAPRLRFMLQDIIELRERKWIPRVRIEAPTTIAQVHEEAEKEAANRALTMSRGGGPPGEQQWSVAGGSTPRPPPTKVGELSKLGRINKSGPVIMGPSSVWTGKKDGVKRDSTLTRVNSSSNMFMLLGLDAEAMPETGSKPSRPSSRRTSVGLEVGRKFQLLPRSKPIQEENKVDGGSVDHSGDEGGDDTPSTMSEAEVNKKVNKDIKEFFSIRNIDESVEYFTKLPSEHHHRLVDKMVLKAIESKEADGELVAGAFARAAEKKLCSISAFEEGFLPVAELLDDIAIDAPKAFQIMATMMKGAGLDKDEERRTKIAQKSMDGDKLVELLA